MTMSPSVQLYDIYRFLAQALRYPEAGWFNDDFLSLYASLLHDLEWPEKEQFVAVLSAQQLEDLQVEYTRLFITGMPQVIASPYASSYIDGTLNGPMAVRTRQFYLDHGFDLASNDFPDHIVNELDFAALLEQKKVGSSQKFLTELFLPWFDLFKIEVLRGTTEDYYKTTIQLIDFFTCLDDDSSKVL